MGAKGHPLAEFRFVKILQKKERKKEVHIRIIQKLKRRVCFCSAEASQADVGWLSVNVAKSLRAFVESVFANSRKKTSVLQFRGKR